MEDLGWLCVKAWRFGSPLPVAGVGEYDATVRRVRGGGGARSTRRRALVGGARHLEVGHHVHRPGRRPSPGVTRSHELAAIGRRVCENEHDLFLALEGRW